MRAIKVLRAEAGLTGIELGRRSGVPRETISRLEHGHYEPTAPTLQKLARALGVEVREIYLLEEQLDAPKAPARSLAGQWFRTRLGHDYLALPDHEGVRVVAAASSIDDVVAIKEAVDAERDVAKSFFEDHDPEPELRASLEMAVGKHLYWRIDLEKRRQVLRDAGETAVSSNDVRLVAAF
ncbi:MAG: helix-turn-helix transcriptional regulator [Rubrobacter sp.]|nr:helix-turn-helix transcriptional regulator [Rubrobacter sp.]